MHPVKDTFSIKKIKAAKNRGDEGHADLHEKFGATAILK
jgi:hypothetical protein